MRVTIMIGFAALALLALPAAALAQKKKPCLEGQAASADCIDSKRASDMRGNAVSQTQPRLSNTSPSRLPSSDRNVYVPRNNHELNNIYTPPLVTRNTGVKP